ncbi:MFS transporter [Pseudomonas sp. FW300-N1A1]|uniref:MFS transporter n=1 Tax=Pseudomonas sp. FW300-N1A1 TaxID=2075555 RepID=UPI000CD2FD4C|nr:MFS transporter [Pseudomonas sp. FW300-N1A1]POA20258.1 MFS transporter [Pseudomonas sp. FW300-N1A1]
MNAMTQADTVEGAKPTPAARWALASLSLSMVLPSLDTSIAHAGLPTLARAFDASFAQVQWIVLAYLLAITTLIVSVGRLGDLVGRRRLLLVGIVIFTGASLACGLAPTLGWLIVARAVQGLGAAIMMALTVALVADTVPQARTGRAMGLLGSMSALGTTLGPSLGGVLIASVGWQAIFLVNVPLGIISLLLAWRYLPADRPRTPRNKAAFDAVGTLVLALTLAAYALAMTLGQGHFGALNGILLLTAACGVGLFAWVESRVEAPLVCLALLRNRSLSAGLAMSLLVSTVIMSTLVVGPFYLARGLELDALTVGLVLSAGPGVAALTGVPAGRIVDRFGARRMTVLGLVSMALGASALAMLPARLGIAGYVVPMMSLTASYALFQTANNTLIMGGVSAQQRGVIAGLLSLSRNLGLITGAAFMGAVFALGSGVSDLIRAQPQAIGTGMQITFAVAVVLIMVALVIAGGSQVLARRFRGSEAGDTGR